LTAQDGVNEIKTKAGTPELNWLIKVSANPKPIFTWYFKMHLFFTVTRFELLIL